MTSSEEPSLANKIRANFDRFVSAGSNYSVGQLRADILGLVEAEAAKKKQWAKLLRASFDVPHEAGRKVIVQAVILEMEEGTDRRPSE